MKQRSLIFFSFLFFIFVFHQNIFAATPTPTSAPEGIQATSTPIPTGTPAPTLPPGGIFVGPGQKCDDKTTFCDPTQNLVCTSGTCGQGATGAPNNPCPSGICQTALGPIPTDSAGFVGGLLRILLGFSGGIAVILIIISGYQMTVSGGNAEKVKAAQEGLTAAIVGLIFIIFATALLQIVGVDILALPGFGK